MRVWVIGRGIPNKNNRMLGSFELGQAKMLSSQHDVSYLAQVFTFSIKNATKGFVFSETKDGTLSVFGRTVMYFPGRMKIHINHYLTYQWDTFLKKVENKTGIPDIIHLHYPSMIGISDSLRKYKERGVKIVCTEHWTHVLNKSIDSFEKRQLEWFVNKSDAFISVGIPLKKAIIDITRTNKEIHVVPNIVSDIFIPLQKPREQEKYIFITAGRLVKVKQNDKVIDAFYQVLKVNRNIELQILGYGEEKENLEKKVSELGIEENVVFTGTLSREEVAERIRNAQCLICYSSLETFGVPIIEAWASGVPVIASDALGFSEYWQKELGYIVSQNNVEDLTKSMIAMMSFNVDKNYLAKYAVENFGEEAILKRINSIYMSTQ